MTKKKIDQLMIWKIASIVLGILFVISIATGGFSKLGAQPSQAGQPSAGAPSAPTLDMAELVDDDDVKGDANAPVTIVEWSDFECPFCVRFYDQTLGQIQSEYIDTGKVKLVFIEVR